MHNHSLTHARSHTHCSAQLLQAVYDNLLFNPQILDITVEDPSDEFVALRDFVDCRNAMKMESFQSPKIHQPFSKELEELCRQKLKLHKVKRETERERERGRGRERGEEEGEKERGKERKREEGGGGQMAYRVYKSLVPLIMCIVSNIKHYLLVSPYSVSHGGCMRF